jgi:hypothetical protein
MSSASKKVLKTVQGQNWTRLTVRNLEFAVAMIHVIKPDFVVGERATVTAKDRALVAVESPLVERARKTRGTTKLTTRFILNTA